jgi:hypothetical protein
MAPERLDTGQAGPSPDIYLLACVLYECLTGELPFPGDGIQQQIAGHLSKPPPRPSMVKAGVPEAFDGVIAKGMAKNPGERYPTAIALAEAAREALERGSRETRRTRCRRSWRPRSQRLGRGRLRRGPRMLHPHPRAQHVAATPHVCRKRPAISKCTTGKFHCARRLGDDFLAFSVILAIWAGSVGEFTNLTWPYPKFVELLCLFLWLLLPVAFGLVAKRCRAGERAVAITSWLICAAALFGALPWVFLLLSEQTCRHIGCLS